ncbi:MAG: rhamnulokinase family protein [Candidatus Methylacidiphilales bacterium]|nr:rhamnulokinase family protein [Candidatus Methylacidiphilales bacterium]
MNPTHVIAVDLGAESGRVIAGIFHQQRLELQEIHRFPTVNYTRNGHWYWDMGRIEASIHEGLAQAFARFPEVASIGIDTWGVDYVLVDEAGQPLRDPYCYRDPRTDGIPDQVEKKVGSLFRRTGIRPMFFNTLFQLVAEVRDHAGDLKRARHLLTTPDYLHFRLGGAPANEWTMASTTGMALPGARAWDTELLNDLGLPVHLLGTPVASGTVTGQLKPELAAKLGYRGKDRPKIILPGSHDTASAVAAVPADFREACFISSGTWSLMGVVSDKPLTGDDADKAQISNEVAWDGKFRPLKNISGLWLVQNCRRAFAEAGREYDYTTLTQLAREAASPELALDADDARFAPICTPDDTMSGRIQSWYAERGVRIPQTDGEIVRAALEGLAQAYRKTLLSFEKINAQSYRQISLVGGGSRSALLCELTAQATGREVLAGPEEATAMGNMLVQLHGLGLVKAGENMRQVVRDSSEFRVFTPR